MGNNDDLAKAIAEAKRLADEEAFRIRQAEAAREEKARQDRAAAERIEALRIENERRAKEK
jgi:hypothetical protein